jgi:hypothetical protein
MGKPCAKPGLARVSLARHGQLRIDKNWVAYFGLQLGHALWQKCVMGVAFLQEPESFLREPDTTHYAWLESLKEEPVWAMTRSTDLSMVDRKSSKAKSARFNF